MKVLMFAIIFTFLFIPLASAQWWNSSWNYRKAINITNNNLSQTLEQGYTINITANFTQLILDNKMNVTVLGKVYKL